MREIVKGWLDRLAIIKGDLQEQVEKVNHDPRRVELNPDTEGKDDTNGGKGIGEGLRMENHQVQDVTEERRRETLLDQQLLRQDRAAWIAKHFPPPTGSEEFVDLSEYVRERLARSSRTKRQEPLV